jgi:hypothetical protein
MKYVYEGTYTQFMGRTFAFGKPVEVTDRATIAALERNPQFRKADEEIQEATKAVLSDECPKCHRIVKRGKVMHQRYCK